MLDYFEKLGSGDAFRRMCILDALTFNPDRHYGNFGVLFNTDTMELISMCPVFDNNRSLFPDLDQEQLDNPDWYLQKCKPMLGKDFLVTARGLLTPQIRFDLIKSSRLSIRPAQSHHSPTRTPGSIEQNC